MFILMKREFISKTISKYTKLFLPSWQSNSYIKHVHMKTNHRFESRHSILYTRNMWLQIVSPIIQLQNQQF